MENITSDQKRHLNSYSIYLEKPNIPLFRLDELLVGDKTEDILSTIQVVSNTPNRSVAASFFTRRWGMFTAMQFYMLAAYDELWVGNPSDITFGAIEEFGNKTVSMFITGGSFEPIEDRAKAIRQILKEQCYDVFQAVRSVATLSPLTSWENMFGFLLWHYHVLRSDPSTHEIAGNDMKILKDPLTWEGISGHSLFNSYVKGCEPSQLLNTKVRTTCCFSKDVPGLLQCGFCPLK